MSAPTTTRRVTPTGRLVLPATAGRDVWLAARRRGVGSSDAPKVLGLYGSALTVWHEKRGSIGEVEQTDAMLFGSLFEDDIAQEWARRNRSVVRRVGLVAHEREPYLRATLDRRVTECPLDRDRTEACGLEVKCRNAFGSANWGTSGVPDDVLAQVLHQMHVTGYDHMHVAVLIGGNDYRQRTVYADRERTTLEWVAEQCRRFWLDHVATGKSPRHNGDGDALIDLDERLYPDRFGPKHLDVEEWIDVRAMREAYAEQHAAAAEAETNKKAIAAALIAMLGGAEHALADNQLVYSYAEQAGPPRVDLEALAERFPDAYAAVVTATTRRVFNARLPRRKKS